MTLDTIVHLVALGLFGALSWTVKKMFIEPIENVQKELIKHVDECNRIPKTLIIEKIDNLSADVMELKNDFRDYKFTAELKR